MNPHGSNILKIFSPKRCSVIAMSTASAADGSQDNLYPIAILIDELRHEDVSLRVNAMKKVDTIAVALGPERTRSELVPFLAESVDDDDEVILALAERLGQFIPLVGGADYAYVLLGPLETLITVEEAAVREKAVASLQHVAAMLPSEHVLPHLWPVLQRCAFRDWFTSRCSAAALIPRVYSRLSAKPEGVTVTALSAFEAKVAAGEADKMDDETAALPVYKEDMISLYQRLCGDETPMVRRASSAAMADMGTAIGEGILPLPPAFDKFSVITPNGSITDAKMAEDSGTVIGGSGTQSLDGYNVDTGDITAAAVPPPVPLPIKTSALTQEHGARAVQALLPMLAAFSRDDQDSVRLLSVDNCVALCRLLNGGMDSVVNASIAAATRLSRYGDSRQEILRVFISLAEDRSWRVRWSVANRMGELADAVGLELTTSQIVPVFERLMQDAESEVRTAAAYRVGEVGTMVAKETIVDNILPCVGKLSEDTSEHVRAALASVILAVAPTLGEGSTIGLLLPIFLRLLKDASPQVRLNIISKLEAVNAVIGLKMLSQSLLPAISELSNDKQWRVRLAIIDFMPLLARQLGADFFDAELTGLCIRWLSDSVFAIREAAANNLRKLTEVFGPAWSESTLIPRLVCMPEDAPYQVRITSLMAAQTLGEALDTHTLQGRVLPFIVKFARDPVANIRFNVAKALEKLANKIENSTKVSLVRPVLFALAADSDDDVKFYATRALSQM